MKILASDFDDTIFYQYDETATKKNIESIKRFIKAGNIFCIVTGRNYSDLKIFLNKYEIPYSYLICEDGAKIFNNVDYCLDTILLPKEEIEKILPVLEKDEINFYLDDGYNKTENYNDCVKIVINCTDDYDKEKIINKLNNTADIHIYASRTHINIINKSVNKKNALKRLFNIENLNLDLLNVIGDNDNDYEMLKSFKGGVIKKHHQKLDELGKKEYLTLSDFIGELE